MIKKDISRTYPSISAEQQLSLERILCAYAGIDTEVGYCQGMAFIAAAIMITQQDELTSFCTFFQVMRDKNWRELYKIGTPGLLSLISQTSQLVARLLPALHAHLNKVNVDGCFSQFFLTVYLSSLPWEASLRVFDVFILEGADFLVNLLVKMLQLHQYQLLQMDEEELYDCLRRHLARDCFEKYDFSVLMLPPVEADEFAEFVIFG
jgi:hypothetical protein